ILVISRFSGIDKIFFLTHACILPNFCEVKKYFLQKSVRKRCTTCTVAPSTSDSAEKRSTFASPQEILFAPGGCRYDGAHAAAPSGGRMRESRTDRRSG